MKFGDFEIKKRKFHHRKNLILLENVDIEKMQVSYIVFFWRKECKYFIGYKDNDHKIKPSCIMPQKTSAHVKSYDGEKN